MTRVVAISAGSDYTSYLEKEAVEEAYWEGRGAQLLELEWQRVRSEQVNQLAQRIDPRNGESLKSRNGQKIVLFDAVVHAPKSASVMGLVDERVLTAHRMATKHLMGEMEGLAAVHRGEETIPTGNLLMAAYEHRLSRAQDVHLHTHIATMNLSYYAPEERWMALRSSPIFYERHGLTEKYRSAFASRLEDIGYRLSDKPMSGFEIAGVPKELIDKYSQRSAKILKKLEEGDERITEKNVAWWTRPDKDLRLSPDESKAMLISRLTPAEHDTLYRLKEQALERQSLAEKPATLTPHVPGAEPEQESPKSKLKLSLEDHTDFEAGLKQEHWNYGEGPTYKSASRMRVG